MKIFTHDNNGKLTTAIAAAIGDNKDYNIFSIEHHHISADTYHYAYSSILKDISMGVPAKVFFDTLPSTSVPTIPYSVLTDKDTVVALPLIFTKLKEVKIVEGKITNSDVRYSFSTYHPLLLQWFSTVTTIPERQVIKKTLKDLPTLLSQIPTVYNTLSRNVFIH